MLLSPDTVSVVGSCRPGEGRRGDHGVLVTSPCEAVILPEIGPPCMTWALDP